MKTLLTIFTITFSTIVLAAPNYFMCDSSSLFKYQRLEFSKLNATDFDFTLSKEESCGRGSGCSHLSEKIKTVVTLIESPTKKNLFITPSYIQGEKIEINLNSGKCKIQLKEYKVKIKAKLYTDPDKCNLQISMNSRPYSKLIKRVLERKGYWFFEDKDAPTVNVEISTLQGGGDFLNINLFADATIDMGNDGYIDAHGNIEGSVFIGFIAKKGMIKKALNRLPRCTNF